MKITILTAPRSIQQKTYVLEVVHFKYLLAAASRSENLNTLTWVNLHDAVSLYSIQHGFVMVVVHLKSQKKNRTMTDVCINGCLWLKTGQTEEILRLAMEHLLVSDIKTVKQKVKHVWPLSHNATGNKFVW